MCFDNDSAKISLIYWADPQLALRFGDLYEEILDKRSRLPAARTHPYLFVCLDSRQRELGNPVKVAGIRKAYYAACTRAGIEPHRNHATGHRARGGYTQLMREAGMDAEQRSKLLHQSRTSSERPYSADVYALHNVLAEHFKRRERGMRE
jgi:integrase